MPVRPDPASPLRPRRALFAAAIAVSLALTLAGCTAHDDATPSTPQPSASASAQPTRPAGGALLSTAGIEHGPEDFYVPQGLVIDEVIDQSNVVTLILTPDQGAKLHAFLAENLPAMGWTLDGSSDDALYFTRPGWEGAFVTGETTCGLTLRAQPGSFTTPSPRP